jgi:hypothetical protein
MTFWLRQPCPGAPDAEEQRAALAANIVDGAVGGVPAGGSERRGRP